MQVLPERQVDGMTGVEHVLNIANSPKSILLVDPTDGRVLDASAAALKFYGWSLSEIKNMHIHEINTLRREEIQEEMEAALHAKRSYFRFRHITRSGEVKRVNITSLPITINDQEVLFSIIESPSESAIDHIDDIKGIYEFSTDPLILMKVTSALTRGIVVHSNASARAFFGDELIGKPLTDSILVYDRNNFEVALARMTDEYFLEVEILFKTPGETAVKAVGMSRIFYDSDYYVLLQIRPPKGLRVNRIRRSELMARLDDNIFRHFSHHPEVGGFGILSLNDADLQLRTMGKEEYLKLLLYAGNVIRNVLDEPESCELLDESMLFFHTGTKIRVKRLREALEGLNEGHSSAQAVAKTRFQCVVVTYQGEIYNPDLGLSYAMVSALEKQTAYTQIKMITDEVIRRTRLGKDLKGAVERKELFLLYQPIIDVSRGEIFSLEALVRWEHPVLGLVEPSEFISLAEELEMITEIDSWVLEEVLSQPRVCPVHINLSTQDLLNDRFRERVIEVLKATPERIVLELTETTNFELSSEISESLNAVNAKLSIDDFGTGYSSMVRLTALNVSSLKIDQSFVMKSGSDMECAAICIATIRLGKGLNIDVIAEGVETPEQIRFLYRNGCRLVQGYGLSVPVPYDAIQSMDFRRFKMESQEKYGTLSVVGESPVDLNKTMMLEMTENLKFIRTPVSFSRLTGYTQADFRHKSFFDLIPEEDQPSCVASCRTLKETGHVEVMAMYLVCADGSRKCVSINGRRGTGGDLSTYLYVEQNEADEERIRDVQGVQGAYSTLFHQGPLATVVWRQDFEIIDWNHEAETTFGWSRDEAIGRNIIKLMTSRNSFPDYMEVFNRIMSANSTENVNYNLTKSGGDIICRWVNSAIRDKNGNIRFFISMGKDITQDLIKSDQIKQLSSAVEKSGSGVVLTDDDGIILSANKRFAALTGYSEEELVGSNIHILNSKELPHEIYENLWRTIRKGDTWEGEIHNRRKDGSLYWCKNTIVPVVSEWTSTVHYLGIQKDLTAEKEQEEKSNVLRGVMVEQDKLATLGSMLAGITHEAYNFMAYAESNLEYTRGLAEKAIEGKALDPVELLSAVTDTQEGLGRIKDMLQSLKNVSRKDEKPRVENCEINNEIRMLAGLVRNEYKYYATLEFLPEEAVPHIGYPGLLRQVIMNILINAAHAIRERNSQSLGKIVIRSKKTDTGIRIVIQDDGVGLDKETKERMFEPFFTTKRTGEGTGLGLSISRGIIEEQYGGKLLCESEPGVGTTFIIEVPDMMARNEA